jgi:hypothetical protein
MLAMFVLCAIPSALADSDELGTLRLNNEMATGKYISFDVSLIDGTVSDYRLLSNDGLVGIVQYLSIEGLVLEANSIDIAGRVMLIGNETIEVKVHDNPTGMIQIKNDGATTEHIMILLAEGLSANLDMNNDESVSIIIEAPGINGVVHVVNGLADIDETDIGTYIDITLDEKDDVQIFFEPMVGEENDETEDLLQDGIGDGTIVSEISISLGSDDVEYDVTSYDQAMTTNVRENDVGGVVIQVSSDIDEGKVFFISIGSSILDYRTDLNVTLDGAALSNLSTPEDVIEAAHNSSQEAVFYFVQDGKVTEFFVYIPTFSTHEVEISPAASAPIDLTETESHDLIEWGLAVSAAICILGLAGCMVARRY